MRILRPALLLTFLVLVFSAIDPVWRIDPDAAAYLSLGKAVAQGEGYVLGGELHGKYPPGWPLLLAGLARLADIEAYGLFHAALAGAWLVAVLLAYALSKRLGLEPWPALAVAACVALSQTLFELSIRYLRTEPLFLALSLAALLCMLRAFADSPDATSKRPWGTALLAGALVVACLSVRLAGVSLLAVPAVALLRGASGRPSAGRRTAALIVLALGAAGVLGWMMWGQHLRDLQPGAPDYSTEFLAAAPRDLTKVVQTDVPQLDAGSLGRRILGNVGVFARASAVLLTNVDKAGARAPVGFAMLAVVLLGAVGLLRKSAAETHTRSQAAATPGGAVDDRRFLCCVYLAATLALYLLWPFDQQERFYVPLLPLLLICVFEGAQWVARLLVVCAQSPALRVLSLLLGGAALAILAAQRSDDPSVLGRWSKAYTLLLLAGGTGLVGLAWWMFRGRDLRAHPALWLLAPLLFAVPFGALRFREWPALVQRFQERREAEPRSGPLERIEVHPVLEQVADYLASTPTDTVVMTDVPKMLAFISNRRCIPFVFQAEPPAVLLGEADVLFYTRELPEAARVVDAVSQDYEAVLELPAVDDGQRLVTPAVLRPR